MLPLTEELLINLRSPLLLGGVTDWAGRVLWGGLTQTVSQLVFLVGPFFAIAVLLHFFERVVATTLSRRFGWRSVMWTGWLGTPIHELSHAALCIVFRHKIKRIALFQPDEKTRLLGYVAHSWNPKSIYQTVGNFFIGVAPLAGGSLALLVLLQVFYPSLARDTLSGTGISEALSEGSVSGATRAVLDLGWNTLTYFVTADHLLSWQFWLFLYLALCVGSHMAPSPQDLKGAKWGAILLVAVVLMINFAHLAVGGEPGAITQGMAPVTAQLVGLFALCAAVCGLSTLAIVAIVGLVNYVTGANQTDRG